MDDARPASSEAGPSRSASGGGNTDDCTVAASARHLSHQQQLGLASLVCLIFLEVAGGPFGTEDAVSAAGPRLAILGFLVLPFIWSIPEALICAELATAFPENSGYVVWVESAFGPFAGFLEGFFSWVSGVTDNTIYPIMLLSYLKLFMPWLEQWWIQKVSLMVTSFALTYVNYRGLDIVGTSSEFIVLLVLAPFVVLTALAVPRLDVSNWVRSRPLGEVQWINFCNVMFWNLNSWDSVSTLAGEVRNPGRLFPRALLLGLILVVLTYLVPLMMGVGVMPDTDGDWQLGYYGFVAQQVGGQWLAVAVTVSAAVSQVGMFEAEMSSDSYQVLGMAERGYLPSALGRRSRYGTPIVGILLSSIGIISMLVFSFKEIVEMLNVVYALGELLEFAAFIHLRVNQPDLHRAFRVPLPVWGLVIMLLPASALLCSVLVLPIFMHQLKTTYYTIGVFLLGCAIYAALQLLRRTGVVHFTFSAALEADRWGPTALAAALVTFPAFLFGLLVNGRLPWWGALGVALCFAFAGTALGSWAVACALQREHNSGSGTSGVAYQELCEGEALAEGLEHVSWAAGDGECGLRAVGRGSAWELGTLARVAETVRGNVR